ncbi:fibrinogen C domain-containing protein 1-like [Clytia hemisphaerica]|uniref:fibrinogen C domain-containing protein 1-like n=1 Tax=Clytia hemisphaerica TaxID=252671 RepID=UPI0034D4BA48
MLKTLFIFIHIIRCINATHVLFNRIGENVEIQDIEPFYEGRVTSKLQCSLLCQRHKCVFAQFSIQYKSLFRCYLFNDVDDVISKLSERKGSQLFMVFNEPDLSQQVQKPMDHHLSTTTSNRSECLDWYEKGHHGNDVYSHMIAGKATQAYCIMEDQAGYGGGWTAFQRRTDAQTPFSQGWEKYKNGFGEVGKNHWLGLEQIHRFTKSRATTELLICGKRFNGEERCAHFEGFAVGDEASEYKLKSGYPTNLASRNLGKSWSGMDGVPFSTLDSDNDYQSTNCAAIFPSGWWMRNCFAINLNGLYRASPGTVTQSAVGIVWNEWRGYKESLKETKMLMRRKK